MSVKTKSFILLTIFLSTIGYRFTLRLSGKASLISPVISYAEMTGSEKGFAEDDSSQEDTEKNPRRAILIVKADPYLIRGAVLQEISVVEQIRVPFPEPNHENLYHAVPHRPPMLSSLCS